MAKDDYFVLVNKLLRYLYNCLKTGDAPRWDILSPGTKDFPIGEEYFLYMLLHLLADGYIEGVVEVRRVGRPVKIKETTGISITPKGIDYLEENSTMKKATEFLGQAGEIAAAILPNVF